MIGCLLAIIAFFLPRVAIVLSLIFGTWIQDAFRGLSSPFNGLLLPILGLIFVPYTLLAYCFAYMQSGGKVGGMWIVLIVFALLVDLGVVGGGRRAQKQRKKED